MLNCLGDMERNLAFLLMQKSTLSCAQRFGLKLLVGSLYLFVYTIELKSVAVGSLGEVITVYWISLTLYPYFVHSHIFQLREKSCV